MEFNTVSISDGITMGSEGMRTSLVSREVIADSIELVTRGNLFDGLVILVGCDKTIPGGVMALVRLDVPGLVLYGGSIAPGQFDGHDVTIQDVFEAVGTHAAGRMSDEQLCELENVACPGPGACGGQFTANTMSTVCELLGVSPMAANGVPAMVAEKHDVARRAGGAGARSGSEGRPAASDRDPGRDRERDCRRGIDRWVDERRAPPARHRARGRAWTSRSGTSTASASERRCWPT